MHLLFYWYTFLIVCFYLFLATFSALRVDFILRSLCLPAPAFFAPGTQLGLTAGGVALGFVRDGGWGQHCALAIFDLLSFYLYNIVLHYLY